MYWCCDDWNKEAPGCRTRQVSESGGKHKPIPGLKGQVAQIQAALEIHSSTSMQASIKQANEAMGLPCSGSLPAQAAALMAVLPPVGFKGQVAQIQAAMEIDSATPIASSIKQANGAMGLPCSGSLPDQVTALMTSLGI
jgi:hypothetical protein